jgi:hypothetical protein
MQYVSPLPNSGSWKDPDMNLDRYSSGYAAPAYRVFRAKYPSDSVETTLRRVAYHWRYGLFEPPTYPNDPEHYFDGANGYDAHVSAYKGPVEAEDYAGGVWTGPTCAPPYSASGCSSSALTTVYEGEDMFFSGMGEVRTSPAPTHRYFWTDGYISQNHNFVAGATTITVRAMGELAAGVGPHIVVTVGGTQIGETTINDTTYASKMFNFTASAGTQEIRVTYDNDAVIRGQDRNLLVDWVSVDAPECTNQTYEAEAMTFVGSGEIQGSPSHRYFWTDGYIHTNHVFVAGPTSIRVTARGEPAGGTWPHMVVSVNGTAIGDRDVNTPNWVVYTFPFTATAGTQEIRVIYDNDGTVGTQDRNLRVDKVDVLCTAGLSVAPGSRSELFPTSWQPVNTT